MSETIVYVELLDEGVDVWRPVSAVAESERVFRLTGEQPAGETWAFPPGSRVRCEERHDLSDGPALVAYQLAGPRSD